LGTKPLIIPALLAVVTIQLKFCWCGRREAQAWGNCDTPVFLIEEWLKWFMINTDTILQPVATSHSLEQSEFPGLQIHNASCDRHRGFTILFKKVLVMDSWN